MKQSSNSATSQSRRQFLKTAVAAGAAGAATAAIARGVVSAPQEAAAEAQAAPPRGYEETEHVRNYYHCARF